jgi:hypothetical protein
LGKLGKIGVQLLNCLLAAHDTTVKTACHENKVRGLGALWRGESDRVVREETEQCAAGRKSKLSVANHVWPLSILFVLSIVSELFHHRFFFSTVSGVSSCLVLEKLHRPRYSILCPVPT